MEVLRKGRPQRGNSKKYTCTGAGNGRGGCGAVLLVSEYDMNRTVSTDYGGGTDYYATFCCPECGVETDVSPWPSFDLKGTRPTDEERREMAFKNKPK